jgi:hypothetical protein
VAASARIIVITIIVTMIKKFRNRIMIAPVLAQENRQKNLAVRELKQSYISMTPSAFVRRHLRVWDCFIADGSPTRRGT